MKKQVKTPQIIKDIISSDKEGYEPTYAFDEKDYTVQVNMPSESLKTKNKGIVGDGQ